MRPQQGSPGLDGVSFSAIENKKGANFSPLEEGACLEMKNIGKLRKPYARFDEVVLEDYKKLDYLGTVLMPRETTSP